MYVMAKAPRMPADCNLTAICAGKSQFVARAAG
jgi:hypothetical protein